MKNTEKKLRWVSAVLCIALFMSLPIVSHRVSDSSVMLTGSVRREILGIYGEIRSADGTVLMEQDGSTNYDVIFADLVGCKGGKVAQTLFYQYAAELTPRIDRFGSRRAAKRGNIMTTTLMSPSEHRAVIDAFHGNEGAVYAYNYVTGEVLLALSVRKDGNGPETESKVLTELHINGSTMKVLTTLLAAEQDRAALDSFTYDCVGRHGDQYRSGEAVFCSQGPHGANIGIVDMLGKSCNRAFANMAATDLDMAEAKQDLEKWGIGCGGVSKSVALGELKRSGSYTNIRSSSDGHTLSAFCGQGDNQISLIDLAQIAGAIANNGKAAEPYLVQSIVNDNDPEKPKVLQEAKVKLKTYASRKAAHTTYDYWKLATDTYYRGLNRNLVPEITAAKTGTAELEQPFYRQNSFLLGILEDSNVAFVVKVENFDQHGYHAADVANVLAELIAYR
ncbi:MAG: hypothetical protein IJO88_01125 [Oscillospiraceae bacterium]|nr:hypothetical protein [Oscillospiraceae bacterium]